LVVHRAVVQFKHPTRSVAENAGVVHLALERTGRTAVAASIDYARLGGSATAGADFTLRSGTARFAPGETRATIPVPVRNDVWPEGTETITVKLSRPGPRTSTGGTFTITLSIGESDQRPDALISNTPARSGYVGGNIYNTTATGQTVSETGRRGTPIWFWVRIRNAGGLSTNFRITGSDASSGSRVRYYDGVNDITQDARSRAGWKVRVVPSRHVTILVQIVVGPHADTGTIKSSRVTARWTGDGPRIDVVQARVRVVA